MLHRHDNHHRRGQGDDLAYLDDDFSASVKLAKLVGHGPAVSIARRLVLVLQIIERSVYAANLSVRPPLDAMPPTEPLEGSHRYVHRLVFGEGAKKKRGEEGGGEPRVPILIAQHRTVTRAG